MNKDVLIVEDDLFILDIISHKFTANDYKAFPAKSVEEARTYLLSNTPVVIVLDIILPNVNGIEFLKELKSNDKTKSIPVVIFSNLGSTEEIKQAMDLGASAYLVKANFTPGEIVEKVNKILAK